MLHQIGIGALGPVFRTYEPARDRLVAVKVFRLDIIPEQAQALAEALGRAIDASLFHPSIVAPIAAGVEGTVAYRAEEYVAAESLDVAMRHYAPAPLDKVLPFITQLAGAIDFARAAGVGHGGLHPRDIFVTPDEARATGFGVVEALERVGIRAPTRRPYAAPERIAGASWSTPADVFSLGAIAFELLTGRRPSGTGGQIGALPDTPHAADLHAVLARAMHDDPAARFSSALAFAAAVEAAGRGEVPAAAAVQPIAAVVPTTASEVPTPVADATPLPIPDDIAAERALDEADYADRSLFDPPMELEPASGDVAAETLADLGEREPERFAEEFVAEPQQAAEARRPLEAVHEPAAPLNRASNLRMFGASPEEEPVVPDLPEPSRQPILPIALAFIVGLLIGFGGAYFLLFGPERPGTRNAAATAEPAPGPAASTGPATPEKAGQYSEQKVTPPASRGNPPAASGSAAPPVPDESAGTRAAAPSTRREPAATRGRLVITSRPTRASVTVNGTWRGRTPLTIENLPFGRYTVRVVQAGYAVTREDVVLSARGATQEVSARLEPERTARTETPRPAPRAAAPAPAPAAPAAPESFTGSLYVDSRPRGATVFVDGRSVGQTPLSLPEVSIGSHVVRLELTGKRPWSTSTTVTAGRTSRVTGSLEDR